MTVYGVTLKGTIKARIYMRNANSWCILQLFHTILGTCNLNTINF